MIQNLLQKIKCFPRIQRVDLIQAGVVALAVTAAFGLGRISVFYGSTDEFMVTSSPFSAVETPNESDTIEVGNYVASYQGAAYHLPQCPGAKRILKENRIWFTSRAEAEAAGYAPAQNCEGL